MRRIKLVKWMVPTTVLMVKIKEVLILITILYLLQSFMMKICDTDYHRNIAFWFKLLSYNIYTNYWKLLFVANFTPRNLIFNPCYLGLVFRNLTIDAIVLLEIAGFFQTWYLRNYVSVKKIWSMPITMHFQYKRKYMEQWTCVVYG